jgi:hypothetical protein
MRPSNREAGPLSSERDGLQYMTLATPRPARTVSISSSEGAQGVAASPAPNPKAAHAEQPDAHRVAHPAEVRETAGKRPEGRPGRKGANGLSMY